MRRRGVYEADLPASSRRITTSPLIPHAFQLRRWNAGEDDHRTRHIQGVPEQFGACSTSRHDAGLPQPMLEPPSDEAGTDRNRLRSSSEELHALFMLSLLEFFKIFWFTLTSWTRTQHCTI